MKLSKLHTAFPYLALATGFLQGCYGAPDDGADGAEQESSDALSQSPDSDTAPFFRTRVRTAATMTTGLCLRRSVTPQAERGAVVAGPCDRGSDWISWQDMFFEPTQVPGFRADGTSYNRMHYRIHNTASCRDPV